VMADLVNQTFFVNSKKDGWRNSPFSKWYVCVQPKHFYVDGHSHIGTYIGRYLRSCGPIP
jgi:hypothetical protein